MSAPLVVLINGFDRTRYLPIAELFYKWGATTMDGLDILDTLVDVLGDVKSDGEAVVALANYLDGIDGGVYNDAELAYLAEHYPDAKHDHYSGRCDPLMALTEEGQSTFEDAAIAGVHIDLGKRTVSDGVTSFIDPDDYEDDDEMLEDLAELDDTFIGIDELPKLPSPEDVPFDQLKEHIAAYKKFSEEGHILFRRYVVPANTDYEPYYEIGEIEQ